MRAGQVAGPGRIWRLHVGGTADCYLVTIKHTNPKHDQEGQMAIMGSLLDVQFLVLRLVRHTSLNKNLESKLSDGMEEDLHC